MPSVFDICAGNNGVPTWTFSQSDFAVLRHIFSDSATRYGICAALSAHWIERHAHDGSLANELGGGGVGPLNLNKLNEIKILHSTVSRPSGGGQRNCLEEWLRQRDLLPLRASSSVRMNHVGFRGFIGETESRDVTGGRSAGPAIPDIEGTMVRAMQQYNTCYLRLNFGGKWGGFKDTGHAVAVWLGGPTYGSSGDALFFDPNYGEFWFENKADFFRFFPYFYRATYLKGVMNFNRRWEVLPCALRVQRARR